MMSLRARLLLGVVSLLAAGLITAAVVTVSAVRHYQFDHAEQQLRTIGRDIEAVLGVDPSAERTLQRVTDEESSGWFLRALARGGGVPALFQLRTPDGETLRTTSSFDDVPALPDSLTPGDITPGNPDGEVFRRLEAHGDAGWRDRDWLVRAAWLPQHSGILVIGMQLSESENLLRRLLLVEVLVTVVALTLVGLLGSWVVRRGLRPLDGIARTATAIGEGDLTRRMSCAGRRTEIDRLGSALNAMIDQLERAFAQRHASEERLRRFLADASHELRTPVSVIRGYAELFRHGAADRPEDLTTSMRRIETEASRTSLLIDELLLLARLDEGRSLQSEVLDLTGLVDDAAAAARAMDPDRPIAVEVRADVAVRGDATRLRQALDNLLTNACTHTPAGTAVTVRVERTGSDAVVHVSDAGPGLSPEQRERVFERFYRGPADPTRPDRQDRTGTGLGLAIVAAIAAAHGGSAEVDSEPGAGSTFTLRLPAVEGS